MNWAGWKDPQTREIAGWVLYDWANSAFATTIMAGFFPLYFKLYLSSGVAPTISTARLGLISALSVLLLGLLSPLLGVLSDLGGTKKRFLFVFTLIGAGGAALLATAPAGAYLTGALFYGLASLGFSGAVIFYDALLPGIARGRNLDRISAAGYAWGYLGGGLLFVLNVVMYLRPAAFGLTDTAAAVRASFITVGIWWLVFSLPLFLFVREPLALGPRPHDGVRQIAAGLRRLADTFRHLREYRHAFLFLGAYLLYNDGVGTVIKMAVDYGLAIGLAAPHLMQALLMVQFIGFPAALAFGWIGARFHPKTGIFLCLGIYLAAVLAASRMQQAWHFYALASLIGLVQGGIQALSRSYFARLFPAARSGEFFGFYSLVGKFSGVAGPLLVAATALATRNSRLGILAVSILFLGGGWLLTRVRPDSPPDRS